MSDLIDRQAAIDALDFEIVHMTAYCDGKNEGNPLAQYNKGLEDGKKAIEALPSAQQEQQWIPCSERLPDTNRDVLLQFSASMGVGFWEHNSWGVNTGDNIYSEIGEGEAQPIAWCELPEQYQGGGKQE